MNTPTPPLELNRPYPFAEVDSREGTYCSECGVNSRIRPASELTVWVQAASNRPNGNYQVFCEAHAPLREGVAGGGGMGAVSSGVYTGDSCLDHPGLPINPATGQCQWC